MSICNCGWPFKRHATESGHSLNCDCHWEVKRGQARAREFSSKIARHSMARGTGESEDAVQIQRRIMTVDPTLPVEPEPNQP